jgi:hypothetical protein
VSCEPAGDPLHPTIRSGCYEDQGPDLSVTRVAVGRGNSGIPVSSSLEESHVIATIFASLLPTACKTLRTSSLVHYSHISAIFLPAGDVHITAIEACWLPSSHPVVPYFTLLIHYLSLARLQQHSPSS